MSVPNNSGQRVREWTPAQKVAASKARGTKPIKPTKYGTLYSGLIYHLYDTQRLHIHLVYEAYLNNMTLDNWIQSVKTGENRMVSDLFIPRGASLVTLDGNWDTTDPQQIYCFQTLSERMKWQLNKYPLPVNETRIRILCADDNAKRRRYLRSMSSSILLAEKC
jgi:hypothetical protein